MKFTARFSLFNRKWDFGWSPKGQYVLRIWLINFLYFRRMVWQIRFLGFYLTSTYIPSIYKSRVDYIIAFRRGINYGIKHGINRV